MVEYPKIRRQARCFLLKPGQYLGRWVARGRSFAVRLRVVVEGAEGAEEGAVG